MDINIANLSGKTVSEVTFDHKCKDRSFYQTTLSVPRNSGINDLINLIIPENVLSGSLISPYTPIKVCGEIRTFNTPDGHLKIYLFVKHLEINTDKDGTSENDIKITGTIAKVPILRASPAGKIITDLLVAINRNYSRSSYLPCIAWFDTAHTAAKLSVGDRIHISGRFQSRTYIKNNKPCTAYELSVSDLHKIEADK